MKLWEIVKGMSEGKYVEGDSFSNSDMGEIEVFEGRLIWSDNLMAFIIIVGDDSEWEEVK